MPIRCWRHWNFEPLRPQLPLLVAATHLTTYRLGFGEVVVNKQDKQLLKRQSVLTCWQTPDYADPLIEQMIGLAQQQCREFHSSTSNNMGLVGRVLAGADTGG